MERYFLEVKSCLWSSVREGGRKKFIKWISCVHLLIHRFLSLSTLAHTIVRERPHVFLSSVSLVKKHPLQKLQKLTAQNPHNHLTPGVFKHFEFEGKFTSFIYSRYCRLQNHHEHIKHHHRGMGGSRRWRRWSAYDVCEATVKRRKRWRMNCDVGEVSMT